MQLHEMNRSLIGQHGIRCTINENISESVKSLHQIVQKAARLRGIMQKFTFILAIYEANGCHFIFFQWGKRKPM